MRLYACNHVGFIDTQLAELATGPIRCGCNVLTGIPLCQWDFDADTTGKVDRSCALKASLIDRPLGAATQHRWQSRQFILHGLSVDGDNLTANPTIEVDDQRRPQVERQCFLVATDNR